MVILLTIMCKCISMYMFIFLRRWFMLERFMVWSRFIRLLLICTWNVLVMGIIFLVYGLLKTR